MKKPRGQMLTYLSSLMLLLPQSWCCWLIPANSCQQNAVAASHQPERCCGCKHTNDSKPEPTRRSPCPQHGACADSLRDWAKPVTPSWDDGFNSIAYLLPLGLALTGDSANLLDQDHFERILSPPLHVQQCVWRC
jgi:hypothetical protein